MCCLSCRRQWHFCATISFTNSKVIVSEIDFQCQQIPRSNINVNGKQSGRENIKKGDRMKNLLQEVLTLCLAKGAAIREIGSSPVCSVRTVEQNYFVEVFTRLCACVCIQSSSISCTQRKGQSFVFLHDDTSIGHWMCMCVSVRHSSVCVWRGLRRQKGVCVCVCGGECVGVCVCVGVCERVVQSSIPMLRNR